MAQRKKDGTWELDSSDFMTRGLEDARHGRSQTPPSGGTATQNAAYNEAYGWGAYLKNVLDRNYV